MNADLFHRNGLDNIGGGVIHLGAHRAEELPFYQSHGATWVIWAEANPDLWPDIERVIVQSDLPQHLIKSAIANCKGTLTLHKFGFSECNSLFPPDADHAGCQGHPLELTTELGQAEVQADAVDVLLVNAPLPWRDCRLLTMDLQGAELLAMQGAGKLLSSSSLTHIYTEIHWRKYYQGQATEEGYEKALGAYGFRIVDRDHDGGDEWGNLLFKRD